VTDRYGKVEPVPKPQLDAALLNKIASHLTRTASIPLDVLCARMGVFKGRDNRYSRAAQEQYILISRGLQRLKKDNRAKYIGGRNSGWRLV
jgi:hypothetical protein